MSKTALLLGSTGLVGSRVLNYLLDNKDYKTIKVISRRSLNNNSDKIIEYISGFDNLDTIGEAFECDDVFCCLGTTIKNAGSQENFRKVDYEYPAAAADYAFRKGAKRYAIISSIGADKSSGNFYLRVKGEIEAKLSGVGFTSLIILRPSLLLGDRKEERTGEKIGAVLSGIFSFMFIGKLKKYKPVTAEKVALAMIKFAGSNNKGIKTVESDEIQEINV